MSGSGTRIWWQNFGQDGMFWNLPFQTTAQWITSGSLVNILRQGSGHVHLPGDFCIPFVVGQATDPLVTIIDSSGNLPNFQLHIPLGTVQEQPITGTDNGLGVADVTKPYALYTLNSVTMNTSSVQASGTVITCHNALAIDDACGPLMMDAITGQPGTGNAFGAIQDAELTAARADPNYVIQHMLAYEMDPSQMNSAAAIWPLLVIDRSFPNSGGMNQGYTIGIPANVPRPTGMSRGKALLWDVFQQFGAFFYNVSGNGTISIDCFWSSAANQSLANDVANSFASIVPQLSILSNQTGLSSMKGMVNGIRSDAFPAPPILNLSPTGGLEVAPSTMGAFHPSGYNVVPSAVLSAPALTIVTPSQQNANASFAVTGGISGYTSAPTLNYEDDASSQSAPNPLVIMPLGDSVTAGGGTAVNGGPPPGSYRGYLYQSLTADGYNVNYVGDQTVNPGGGLPSNQDNHEGLGGFGIITVQGDQANPGILDYLQANNTLTTYRPNLILLMAGFNNLFVAAPANLGPTATYAAMQQLCTYIVQTLPSCKLMVSAEVGAADVPGNDTSNELGQLNALIPGLSAISPNITVINGCSLFNYDGSDTGPDGLHPNVAGCQAIAAAYEIGIKALYPSGAGGTFIPLPSGNSVTASSFSFTNPGLVVGTHHVTVRDANNTSVVVSTGAFSVVAGAAAVILPVKPSLPVTTLPFTFSGTMTGYGAAPTLTYSDNSGVATALPSGSTVTASTFSFLHPGLASGNFSTAISDGSVSGGASYTVTQITGGVSPSPSTILAGATSGLNDAAGNRWSITSGGQVAVNGVIDTTTSNVTELAWVSPLMWQLTASGLWFSKSSPTAAWSPAAGTTTSPLVTTPTIAINAISSPSPNTTFVISGSLANYSAAPTLTYSDNSGAAVALPSGRTVTTTAFSFTHPGMPAGADTVTISDGTHSASQTYSVSTAGWTSLAPTPNLSNTVPGLAASTSYDIEVYATNSVGQGPPSSILTVSTGVTGSVAPGVPTGLTSTSVAQTTVNLSWAAPAIGTPPITYATRSSLTGANTWTSGPTVSGTTAQITGLSGGTTYDFEVDASNSAGTSAFSAPFTIATNTVSAATVTWGTNSGSMVLTNGNLTATAGGSTTAYASHSAVLSTTSLSTGKASFEVTMATITQNSAIGLATATFPLGDGLGADTQSVGYYMSTGTGSQIAQTVYINNNPILTPAGNLPAADTAGAVFTFCVDLDAQLFWVTSPAIIAAYGANAWNDSATANPSTGVGGISFAGLAGGTAMSIVATTEEGGAVFTLNAGSSTFTRAARIPGTFPAWSGTTVAAVAPGVVTNLVAGTPSNVSIPLSWTAPSIGSLPLTYNVMVSPKGANTFTLATTSPTTSASVTGLTANTGYDFRVFATNSAGTGGNSNIATATTLTQAIVPGAPVGLSAGTATTTSVPLTWAPPTSGGAPTGYQVQYKLATASTWTNVVPTVVA